MLIGNTKPIAYSGWAAHWKIFFLPLLSVFGYVGRTSDEDLVSNRLCTVKLIRLIQSIL